MSVCLELTLDRFDTELFDDYTTVYDGTSDALLRLLDDRFSGPKRPFPVISSGNNLYMRFITDAPQNKQCKKFRAHYRGKM